MSRAGSSSPTSTTSSASTTSEHGHPVGDAVLCDLAYAMRKALRAFDLVYRVGGEEFVVLLPGADLERAIEVGERLRLAVSESRTGDVQVTMSLGAAAARGSSVRFADLYAAADAALYAAKRSGAPGCARRGRTRWSWRSARGIARGAQR